MEMASGLAHGGPLFADVLAQLDDRLGVVGVREDTRAYQVQRHAAYQEHFGNQRHSASSPSTGANQARGFSSNRVPLGLRAVGTKA